jgi:hypothetical protein
VFLQLRNPSIINVKIAPYLKFPYTCKNSSIFNQNAHVEIYEKQKTILPFKASRCGELRYKTYFMTKNNKIFYYNCVFFKGDKYVENSDKHKLFLFEMDIERDVYRPIEFSKLNYYTGKNQSLLFRLKDKFYIISRGLYSEDSIDIISPPRYIGVIDVDSGKALYLEKETKNSSFDLFYPIANRIVPIIQINNSGVHVHLIDLLTKQTYTASWNIDKIWQIVVDLINKDERFKYDREGISPDLVGQIDEARLYKWWGEYNSNEQYIGYLKSIQKYFEIFILGKKATYRLKILVLHIVFMQNKLKVYIDLSMAELNINASIVSVPYNEHYKDTMILLQEIPISPEIPEIHLSNVIYSNKCYDILYHPENGIALTAKKLTIIWSKNEAFSSSLIHRHKKYLFIFKVPTNEYPVCLIVIDTKSNTLYPFISNNDFKEVLREDLKYTFYYLEISDRIIFLPMDLKHIFIIELKELNEKLYQLKKDICEEKKYGYVEDIINIFDMYRLINNAILQYIDSSSIHEKVSILDHYIDSNSNKLYFIAAYTVNDIRYLGLFECVASGKSIFLKIVNHLPSRYIVFYKNKNKSHIDLSKLKIQRIYYANAFNNNLEIVCNDNYMIIDIRSNRISKRILAKDLTAENVHSEVWGDLLHVWCKTKHKVFRDDIWLEELFILSRLNLVNQMAVMSL